VEVQLAGNPRYEAYEFGGLGLQGLAGVSFDVVKHVQLFTEYKFTYANLDSLSIPGGSISLDSMAHHWVFGVGYRF
jgi:opacity protein-like surface antigen